MNDFFLKIYREQILDQINNAEASYSMVINDKEINSLFLHIHYFIIHVSNIFKIIQPKITNELTFQNYRKKNLKIKYPKIPQIKPELLHVRNDFEHFDERIDSWVINSKNHNYADKNIGDLNSIQGLNYKDNFRLYDPKTKTLYFCGNEYPLADLYNYVQEIKKAL